MKSTLCFISIFAILVLLVPVAGATLVQQLDSGGYVMPDNYGTIAEQSTIDLDHYRYYNWYIEDISDTNDGVDQVDIVFHDIYNWKDEKNILNLYIKDYDGNNFGWEIGAIDWQSEANPDWIGNGYQAIGDWTYPDAYPDTFDVVFTITDADIIAMMTNGSGFVLGIDPDCHYWGDKITVNAPVPEPATMLLLGTGLLGLAGLRRKKAFKR